MNLRRPNSDEYAAPYSGYIARVPEIDVLKALETQAAETQQLFTSLSAEKESYRYAEGKWSPRQIAGHIADAERIFGYRAFSFARGEQQALPGFDEGEYIAAAGYDDWTLADLTASLDSLRRAHLILFRNLREEAWDRRGTASDNPITVRALAYIMVGHERHHLAILKERYL
jgi:uncharacterized damage-inducible protein DinB